MNLAWLLATCPDARHRDGKKAVEFAARHCLFVTGGTPNHLNTLAAAYAEGGDFAKAVEWQEKTNFFYLDAADARKG